MYRACSLVANICVYADQNKTKPIALIVPLGPALKKLASSVGVNGELEELVHNEKVNKAVLKELVAAGRSGGLAGIELIEGVVLTDEEWTPQNVSFKYPQGVSFFCEFANTLYSRRIWSLVHRN